jgi:hypothetical protein
MKPRRLNTRYHRESARRHRDFDWAFMRRIARQGIVHYSPWNKNRLPTGRNEYRDGLIGGLEWWGWVKRHRTWFCWSAWDPQRQTYAFSLTRIGKKIARRPPRRFDLEPVYGGLVEPGYREDPILRFHRPLHEQLRLNRQAARQFLEG